ncbi:NADPH-ferredoxin reductase FprA [Thalassovita gelatinovora]|uniref:NADPH-ferredoxin reductase FprA n=1 Tax=Thalassovita gelatinovora TaxID=53501 RepID=A0A0P1F6S4_THAGE|nr:FAD-dependent oxidoreductase [Thalassovita gelatinovora]CUH63635.1 NADPH-ferredoxin reductase FprA [Thalassovita gelatinovora]SER00776.1 ferredoxin--NADP+ reductase [Thalassovita gelatinovora]
MTAKVAIIGAGPSGCYTAQALLKMDPDLEVDVIDAQPTPFGLVRYGVAADHQGTKGVARQFARIFIRQKARFFGNIRIGEQVTLGELQDAYDAVVIAAGLSGDRRLGIPGDDLPGIIGSGSLTRALYEHPDAAALPELGQDPVIIGTGNVAIDVLRLLAKTPEELRGSDLGDGPTAWLAAHKFRKITVVGRSSAGAARFSPVLLKELADLSAIDVSVMHPGSANDEEGKRRLEALAELVAATSGPVQVDFHFDSCPIAIEDVSTGLKLDVETPEGRQSLLASSIITAIGFTSDGSLDRDTMLDSAQDRMRPENRTYTIGWFRNGPVGAIPKCREDAQALAQRVMSELQPDPDRIGRNLFETVPDIVGFDHWQRVDALELSTAPDDRCRRKIFHKAELLRPSNLQDA